MTGIHRLVAIILALFVLTACSIDISPTATAVPTAPAQAATSLFPTVAAPGTIQPVVTNLPVTWADLHLSGKLLYTAAVLTNNDGRIQINSLDLTTGNVTPIFQTGSHGWVDSAVISPDGKQLVISYAPPAGIPNGGQETLYVLPADGSKLAEFLFTPDNPADQNAQVVWSPDGKYLYFAHLNYQKPGPLAIWRAAYPGGKPEQLVDNAYWPRLSPDSSQLTYVKSDPQNGNNHLYIAAADGTQEREVPISGPYIPTVIDVPMFSPDAQTILFSAPDPSQSSMLKWLDTLVTIQLVHPADGSIPSDWFSVPVSGGVPKQLTHFQSLALYGSYSPDNQHIASYTSNGIFVMNPDGTGVTVIVPDIGGIPGTVNWMP